MNTLKHKFPEFYREKLTMDDLKDNLIIFDTNYLLDILRLPVKEAEKYLKALMHVKSNIYIPYLVALEFNFNKIKVKTETEVILDQYRENIIVGLNTLDENIKGLELLKNDTMLSQFTEPLLFQTHKFKEKFEKKLDLQIKKSFNDKEIYNRLIETINENVGESYDQEWVDKIEAEGVLRYKDEIPPGYNDKTKSNETRVYDKLKYHSKYGDLIIWKDILEKAKNSSKGSKIIFVTNDGTSDNKKDLMFKTKGRTIGPHIYLINELKREAQKDLYILNNIRFAELTNALSEEELKELRLSNTRYQQYMLEERKRRNNIAHAREETTNNPESLALLDYYSRKIVQIQKEKEHIICEFNEKANTDRRQFEPNWYISEEKLLLENRIFDLEQQEEELIKLRQKISERY